MNLDYKAIGKRIKEMRKRRKLSQAELAEVIEKSTSYISYIEAGQKCMSLDTFVEIANALAVSTDLLSLVSDSSSSVDRRERGVNAIAPNYVC